MADRELDNIFVEKASLDSLGGDVTALESVNWDDIEVAETESATTRTGVKGNERHVLSLVAKDPVKRVVRQEVENGISYDIETRADGSEWLLGRTGERSGVGIMVSPPKPKTETGSAGLDKDTVGEAEGTGKEARPGAEIGAETGKPNLVRGRLRETGETVPSTGRQIFKDVEGQEMSEQSITVVDERLNSGLPTNIPTIWDGVALRQEDAIQAAIASGQKFRGFNSIDEAVNEARERSKRLGREIEFMRTVGRDLSGIGGVVVEIGRGIRSGAVQFGQELLQVTRLDKVAAFLEDKFPLGAIQFDPVTTTTGKVTEALAQGVSGMVVGGVITRPLKAIGGFLRWTAAGAFADLAGFDPDDPGIGELADEIGSLGNETAEEIRVMLKDALKKNEGDSELRKRLKNVGGGVIAGATVDGLMVLYRGAKGLKNLSPTLVKALAAEAFVTTALAPSEAEGGMASQIIEGLRIAGHELAEPFFSKALKSVRESKLVKATGEQWLGNLRKAGVKDDEIKWTGLDDFLKGKKGLDKEAVATHLRDNQIQIQDVTLGGQSRQIVTDDELEAAATAEFDVLREAGIEPNISPDGQIVGFFDGADILTAADITEDPSTVAAVGNAVRVIEQLFFGGIPTPRVTIEEIFDKMPAEARTLLQAKIRIRVDDEGIRYVDEDGVARTADDMEAAAVIDPELEKVNSAVQSIENAVFLEKVNETRPTKFAQFVLPGGENYREILLTVPNKPGALFRGGHFGTVADNVVAHIRVNERVDADGKKVLFIEELQSDWMQKGRDVGFRADEVEFVAAGTNRLVPVGAENSGVSIELIPTNGLYRLKTPGGVIQVHQTLEDAKAAASRVLENISTKVPDAPFKKTWHEMAMRKVLRVAAENDFDRVAWTTGKQQADRYDFSKQIKSLEWDAREGQLLARDKSGAVVINETNVAPDKLENMVGKDAANKLIEKADNGEPAVLEGLDLKLGDSGMRGFYDKILVNFANKFGKKFGAKVSTTEIPTAPIEGEIVTEMDVGEMTTVHSIDVTEKMRVTALREGFPLFTAAPLGLAAAGVEDEVEDDEEIVMAGFMQKVMKPFIGRGGRQALKEEPESFEARMLRQPPPQGAVEAQARMWEPYKADEGLTGTDFNLDRMNTTEGAKQQINNVSKAYEAQIGKTTGGKIPLALTRQVADMLGADPDIVSKVVKDLPVDTKDLHIRALVMRDTLVEAAEDVDRRALAITSAPDQASDSERLAFREAFARFAALQRNFKGVQTDIARALSGFRIPADASMGALRRAQVTQEALNATGGRDTADDLAKRWLDTPAEKKGQLGRAWPLKVKDAIFETWINGLLSSLRTHEVNLVGNNLFTAWQLPERAIAGAIGKVRQLLPNADPDRVFMAEAMAMMHGYLEAIPDAFRLGWRTFETEMPSDHLGKVETSGHKSISANTWGLDEGSLFGRFVDLVGQGVRLPGRFLMASDEFNKATGKQMERRALAYRQSQEVLDGGGNTKEAAEKYADVIGGKDPDAEMQIQEFADTVTFTKALGEKGQTWQNTIAKTPMGRVIVPFFRTPANIIKETMKRTPAAPFLKEVREDLTAGGARRDLALAKISTGSAAMAFGGYLAAQGIITGAGPSPESRLRGHWLQTHQPYSIKVEGKWYPYGRLEPIATLFGMAADFTEYKKWAGSDVSQEDEDLILARALASVLHTVSEKTFMMGIAEAASVYKDPNRYAQRFIARLAGSSIPFSSMMRDIEASGDPVIRSTRVDPNLPPIDKQFTAMLNQLKARTRGWSADLPERLNFWGEEIRAFDGEWYQAFNAYRPRKIKKSPVDDELLRMRYPLSQPRPEIDGLKLSPQQHHDLVKAMNTIKAPNAQTGTEMNMRQTMEWLVKSGMYQALPHDNLKMDALRNIRDAFVDAARDQMKNPNSPHFNSDIMTGVILKRAERAVSFGGR